MSDVKNQIKRIVIVILIVYVCYLLQTSVFLRLPLAGVTPNILICVVASYGFMKGQKEGMLIGFFVGIVLDIFSSNIFGMYAAIYMYIGFLNGLFKKQFYGDDLKLPMLLIGTSDFIFGIISYIVLCFTGSAYNFTFFLLNIILPELVYTLVVSIFIYYIILKVNNWAEKLDKKGSDRFGTY